MSIQENLKKRILIIDGAMGIIEVKGGVPKATAQFVVRLKDFKIGGILIKLVADKMDIDIVAAF